MPRGTQIESVCLPPQWGHPADCQGNEPGLCQPTVSSCLPHIYSERNREIYVGKICCVNLILYRDK